MKEQIKQTIESLYNEARNTKVSQTGNAGMGHQAGLDAIVDYVYNSKEEKEAEVEESQESLVPASNSLPPELKENIS